MSSDKCYSRTALKIALEFKLFCFERKLMTFAKSHGVNLAVEGFLPAWVLFQAIFRPAEKTNIEVSRFGLGDDNVHVKH
jgi:hypothetical protein